MRLTYLIFSFILTFNKSIEGIVNGVPANLNEAPWFVRVVTDIDCGGVWITKTTILTAAHCFKPWTKRAYVHLNDDNRRYGSGGYTG